MTFHFVKPQKNYFNCPSILIFLEKSVLCMKFIRNRKQNIITSQESGTNKQTKQSYKTKEFKVEVDQ